MTIDLAATTQHIETMTDVELLNAAIDATGLSVSAFARDVLVRDPRSVRRWRAGQKLPAEVRAFLLRQLAQTHPAQQ